MYMAARGRTSSPLATSDLTQYDAKGSLADRTPRPTPTRLGKTRARVDAPLPSKPSADWVW